MISLSPRKDAMDPGEDIIDVLYKCRDTRRHERAAQFRLPNFTRDPNQWPPPISPTYRNYEEDLHRLRRRSLDRCNSWRGDSVYSLKPQLCRTDPRFSFPGTPRSAPSTFFERHQKNRPPPLSTSWIEERPDRVDESSILWGNNCNDPSDMTDDLLSEDFEDDQFLTPTNEEKDFLAQRSIRADIIPLEEEEPYILSKRRQQDVIELPNGARQLRRPLLEQQQLQHRQQLHHHHLQQQQQLHQLHHQRPSSKNGSCKEDVYNISESTYGTLPSSRGIYSSSSFLAPKDLMGRPLEAADTVSRSESRSSLGGGGGLYSSIGSIASNEKILPAPVTSSTLFTSNQRFQTPDININGRIISSDSKIKMKPLLIGFSNVLGFVVMLLLANKWSNYLQTLHENELWFSNIKEVEREISFRTEQGLYYSYFKHLVNAPSLWEGKSSLERDNLTEHLNTINIFQRFNIHQELFLAGLYRMYNFHLEPIFFYVESVFTLQGFFMCALYLIAWKLAGTWIAGVLTTAFVVCYRHEVTRVEFTISLREHFSLPFIFAQFAAIGHYLSVFSSKRKDKTHFNNQKIHLVLIYVLSVVFNLTWQFGQFVLLPQALVLLILGTIQILDKDQVCKVLFVNLMSMLTVWYLQFYQPMVLSSLVVSFIPVAIASLQSQTEAKRADGIYKNLVLSILRTIFVLALAVAGNVMLKFSLNQNDDNHIFSFVKSKLGFADEANFESRLYRCLPAFQAIDISFYVKMSYALLLPLYLTYVGSRACFITFSTFAKWSSLAEKETALKKKDDDYGQRLSDLRKGPSNKPVVTSDSIQNENLELNPEEFDNPLIHMDARPAECFHVCQSLLYGLMAMTTLRMKCLWCPYICVMASVMICDQELWKFITNKLTNSLSKASNSEPPPSVASKIEQPPSMSSKTESQPQKYKSSSAVAFVLRHLVLLFAILLLIQSNKDAIYKELEDLKEFWDPDTVDLMEWIQASTATTAAFTGSMQLLAGVRLSTWRPITNHPHFEDKALRDRTKELYSIYAKVSPEEVHSILVKYNSSYIILEDSICLQAGRHRDRCSLPDTMDLTLGHIPDDGILDPPDLISSPNPRFCNEIRYGGEPYRKLFKKVFENKTFRIYKVKPLNSSFD